MKQISNDESFDEAFKIITSNKSKANSLKQALLKNKKYDKDLNLRIIKNLEEFESDLENLYDILRDLKLSIHDSNLNHKNISKEKDKNKNEIKNKNKKEMLHLNNDFESFNKNYMNPNKTYIMTSQYERNNQKKLFK